MSSQGCEIVFFILVFFSVKIKEYTTEIESLQTTLAERTNEVFIGIFVVVFL